MSTNNRSLKGNATEFGVNVVRPSAVSTEAITKSITRNGKNN